MLTTLRANLLAAALAAGLIPLAAAALADTGAVHCAGWPGAPGVPGLIVFKPACTCIGSLFGRPKANRELVSVRVAEPPRQGAFAMSGLRNFTYAAPAAPAGSDMVVLDVEWNEQGHLVHRKKRLRIVSEAGYYAAGGTQTGPGADMTTSHMQGRRR